MTQPLFEKGTRLLFQGDSITDMGRGRTEDPNHLLGHGYAFLIAAREAADFPARNLTVLNRGISGNTSADLAARWKADTLDLDADVLSVLIGTNDLGQNFRKDLPFSIEDYEATFRRLLTDATAARPDLKLILGEPFIGLGKETLTRFDERKAAMRSMRDVVSQLADDFHAPVVHYQMMFDAAAERAPMEYWIWDGIHPTFAGHRLMADEWKQSYAAFYGSPAAE